MKQLIRKVWIYIKNYIVKKHVKVDTEFTADTYLTAKILTFNKEKSGRWYIYLPDWGGPKAALEMVAGADTLLDSLCNGEDTVILYVDTKLFSDADKTLTYETPQVNGDGAFYLTETSERVWLCGVTEFVFGVMPPKIFCKVITYSIGTESSCCT